MGFLDRFFGGKRAVSQQVAADQARDASVSHVLGKQSTEDQVAVRERMEAELEAQRQRRAGLAAPEA